MENRITGGKTVILRIEMSLDRIRFGQVATAITDAGGDIVAIDVIHTKHDKTVRDVTVAIADSAHIEQITASVSQLDGIKLINVSDRTFLLHLGGKIEVIAKTPVQNRDDLSRVYTPDVARVCMAIYDQPDKAHTLTIKRNTVAVVSDGTAVLGLGQIGPYAAMPVMEGKAMLFKQFANVDAFPICLDTTDTEEIIRIVKAIAPGFGGINLEDISAPRCFEIEQRLRSELDIPVFHDDQHGTAVVLYAALINALKLVNKPIGQVKAIVVGIGAAGIACSNMLLAAGIGDIIGVDREGAISSDQTYSNQTWQSYAERTNKHKQKGTLSEVIAGADIFIGVSAGGILKREHVLAMNKQPIVFAMANPTPEIDPNEIDDIDGIFATGRSDYPNQINNLLCFPGIFRGALDCRASEINEHMKLAAAEAIASVIPDDERSALYIIPSVFNPKIVELVRSNVIKAAIHSGVARRIPHEFNN